MISFVVQVVRDIDFFFRHRVGMFNCLLSLITTSSVELEEEMERNQRDKQCCLITAAIDNIKALKAGIISLKKTQMPGEWISEN